jgi:hypothetical protein
LQYDLVSVKAKTNMMKKIKSTKPSVIFQLVIVVVLFSYRGCSPGNDRLEDMPVGEVAESGHVLKLSSPGNGEPGNGFTVKPFFADGQFRPLTAANGYFFKQFVILKPDGFRPAGNVPDLSANAVQNSRR